MNEPGEIVGMVDVLKLTYATLEQVSEDRRSSWLMICGADNFKDQHDVHRRQ